MALIVAGSSLGKVVHGELYLLNLTLLFAHEVDSAYWHEWELFGLPGGIQLFVVLNAALLALALQGFRWLLQGALPGRVISLVLAMAGLFAFAIHSYFILAGRPEFTLPVPIGLLAAILLASILQAVVAFKELRAA